MKKILFILIAVNVFCYEQYLKPCQNKIKKCRCSFVDYVYVINLDERPEKYARVKKEFERFGITPYRFSAVNGWKLPFSTINSLGLSYKGGFTKGIRGTQYYLDKEGKISSKDAMIESPGRYYSHAMSKGAIGIVLSHLSILKDAYDSGYQRIWILEDDIEILRDLKELELLIKEADRKYGKKWDVLYTDEDTIDNNHKRIPCYGIADRPDVPISQKERTRLVSRKTISNRLVKLGNRYGVYSFIINRPAMKKILRFFKEHEVFLPYDMEFIYIKNFLQLTAKRNIVSHKVGSPSDNGGPNYESKTK